jgi:hypothetical protein
MTLLKVVIALAMMLGAEALTAPKVGSISRVGRLQSTGMGPSLEYNPDKFKDDKNSGNFRKLSDKLKDGDIERKIADEEAMKRENG